MSSVSVRSVWFHVVSLTVAAHAAVEGVGRAAGFGVVMVDVTDSGWKSITPRPGPCGHKQKHRVRSLLAFITEIVLGN